MQLQRTLAGLEVELRSRGVGRFFSAGFLFVWLTGWAVGEGFALWFLWVGAKALLTGTPPEAGRALLETAPALVIGLFLLGWLAFWTIGGIAAWHELLRILWSRDRLVATSNGIEFTRRVGPFGKTRRLAHDELRGFHRRDSGSALIAETTSDAVELTRLGTPSEQEELVRALVAELQLEVRAPLPPALPKDWRELTASDGSRVLTKDPAMRRKQALVAWLIATPVCAAALMIAQASFRNGTLIPLAVLTGVAALALAWGAAWLSFTRTEWKLEPGRIVQQRRVCGRVRELFVGQAVTLEGTKDSDGDTWFSANLVGPTIPHATPRDLRRARRTILNRMNESTESRRLMEWLGAQTGVVCSDRTEPVMPPPDLAALARKLETTGRFGRWVARALRRHDRR